MIEDLYGRVRSPLVVILLSGIVGGVVGFAAAMVGRSDNATYLSRAGRETDGRGELTSRGDDALREVLAEIRALVAVLRTKGEGADSTSASKPSDGGPQPVHRSDEPSSVPEARWDVLEEMAIRSKDAGSFRPWLLLSEAQVIKQFGVPDQIASGAGSETWIYLAPPGIETRKKIILRLSRGRLIELHE